EKQVSENRFTVRGIGYLQRDEVQRAVRLITPLPQPQPQPKRSRIRWVVSAAALAAIALTTILSAITLYPAWQMHQTLVDLQAQVQKQLPIRIDAATTLDDARVGFRTWTYGYTVVGGISRVPAEETIRSMVCRSRPWREAREEIQEDP